MPFTEKGYERPAYDDLLETQVERAKLLFGEDIDTNENTPLGKYIRINVADLAEVYEILEKIYYARFPNTATGVSLDRLCPFVGIARNPSTYARHTIRFKGTPGEYVPSGFQVSTATGEVSFHIYDHLLIGENGTVDGIVECEQAGETGNVKMGSIDTIVNPAAHIDSIEHIGIVQYGEEMETDTALRERFHNTVSGSGSGTVTAIKGAILRVPFVDGVEVMENDTDSTMDGIPPHAFQCFVLSPESQDSLVAEAIFSKKPLGIKAVGDISVDILDESGVSHTISFSRTKQKDIHIRLTINTNHYFESDGIDRIKSNIAQHINNLKNGQSVYFSSLYGYVYQIPGVVNVSGLEMSTDNLMFSNSDITINSDEVARVKDANIEVVVNP